MPLRPHIVKGLATELTNRLGKTVATKEFLEKIIEEYFETDVILMVGEFTIQAAAEEHDLHLADDEIKFIAEQAQDEIDSHRGPGEYFPNIEDIVENWYLEDTQEGARKQCPDFWVIRIDETHHWQRDFLQENKIEKMWTVYLVDRRSITHCCEGPGSYCLHFVEHCPETEHGIQISDEVDGEIRSHFNEDVSYVKASEFDGHMWRDRERARQYRPNEITSDMYEDDQGYNQIIDDLMEYYRGNPEW